MDGMLYFNAAGSRGPPAASSGRGGARCGHCGGVPEWTKGADCKSVIHGFESHRHLSPLLMHHVAHGRVVPCQQTSYMRYPLRPPALAPPRPVAAIASSVVVAGDCGEDSTSDAVPEPGLSGCAILYVIIQFIKYRLPQRVPKHNHPLTVRGPLEARLADPHHQRANGNGRATYEGPQRCGPTGR